MSFDPNLVRNEKEVESKLIAGYLLPKLGYTPADWYQQVPLRGARLDFLIFASSETSLIVDVDAIPGLVVEAKGPNQNLGRHTPQMLNYLTSIGIRYGLLTNGHEVRVYEKVFEKRAHRLELRFSCAIQELEARVNELNDLIGKEVLLQNTTRKKKEPMQTIAIYHNKGGVGKTTVAVNLAAALRRRDFKVLLIDLDSQANATFAVGLVKFTTEEDDDIKDHNVSEVLLSGKFGQIPEVARQSDYNNPEIDVLPGHITMIEQQKTLNEKGAARFNLMQKLEGVEDVYDYVIIDAPPSRDIYAEIAIASSDYLIIPSDLKPFANQGLPNVIDFLERTDDLRAIKDKAPTKLLGILPSKILTNPKYREHTFDRQKDIIKDRYDLPIMDTIISERKALADSSAEVVEKPNGDQIPNPYSIFEHPSGASSAEEFEALADEVIEKAAGRVR